MELTQFGKNDQNWPLKQKQNVLLVNTDKHQGLNINFLKCGFYQMVSTPKTYHLEILSLT